eukprot:8221026-Alexandrium_andersonii.AAC.1
MAAVTAHAASSIRCTGTARNPTCGSATAQGRGKHASESHARAQQGTHSRTVGTAQVPQGLQSARHRAPAQWRVRGRHRE